MTYEEYLKNAVINDINNQSNYSCDELCVIFIVDKIFNEHRFLSKPKVRVVTMEALVASSDSTIYAVIDYDYVKIDKDQLRYTNILFPICSVKNDEINIVKQLI